ncbi:MAG: hypothetical protein CMH22_06265 [Methylophaga sp.]|nr:hypothetical protein [Methylophaga sp.]|tara:strand:+ start:36087 stop:37265 length:1179 start_codon:yes stop_codon:yes gene_type:complete
MFSIIQNYKKRDIVGELNLQEFLEELQNPSRLNTLSINAAREAYDNGDIITYKKIKDGMPCIAFNFSYDSYINTENIIKQTGYLYLDVDSSMDKHNLKKDYVVACWDSLSRRGCGMIVSVSGVNESNLKYAAQEIAEDLGIELDTNAVSVDRLNIISQDSNPYINTLYSEYKYTDKKHNTNTTSSHNIYKTIMLEADSDFFKEGDLRTSNEKDLYEGVNFDGERYIVLEEEQGYTEIFLPPNIKEGKRNTSIFSATSNCRGLNPNATKSKIKGFINGLNNQCCNPPLPQKEVNIIVDNVFSKEPVIFNNRTRKILYNPDYDLNGSERRSIAAEVSNRKRREETFKEIITAIDSWDYEKDGKITNKNIAKKIGKHQNTLTKYSKQIKTYLQAS